MADEVRDKSTAKAADGPGDDVGRQDRMACGCAEIFNTNFVVAYRLHEVAERRGEKSCADIYHGSSEHEHEVVLYEAGMRRRRAREGETSNTEAIGPTREIVELDQHCVEDHRQRKAQHCKIDAAEAHEQQPERGRDQRRYDGRQWKPDQRLADAEPVRQKADRIGANGEIKRMTERDKAAEQEQHDNKDDRAL